MNAKKIFDKLVEIANGYAWGLTGGLGRRQNRGKPGELLNKLTEEEREELKNLTAKGHSHPKT